MQIRQDGEIQLKTYVEYLYQGRGTPTSVNEEYTAEKIDPANVQYRNGCIGFRFFQTLSVKAQICEGELSRNYLLKTPPLNTTKIWFWGGKVYDYEELLRRTEEEGDPDANGIIDNMEYYNIKKMIVTNTGMFMPYRPGDEVISFPQEQQEIITPHKPGPKIYHPGQMPRK